MDKKLPENTAEKDQSAVEPTNAVQLSADKKSPNDFASADVGSYSQKATYNPALTEKSWKELPLKDSVAGRGVIRMFSRGVMGTTAFALGSWYATRKMQNYNLTKPVENWVEGIARAYDVSFGKGIKSLVNTLGKDGEKFVNNFRPTAKFGGYGGQYGRSLGHEVVMVTFDFGAMSIGDFWGRKIAHTLDPKAERPEWKREDGTIDWTKAAKTFGKNWWSAVSYSAGEDWAVAVPYCLTMHHLGTPALNKIFPGYKYEFDRNGNGGGLIINDHGKVTGNFTAAGVLNLWERFTTYNVGTLMFREAYAWTGGNLSHALKHHEMPPLVEAVPGHKHESMAETAADGAKQFVNWMARSTVKAVMYMIPAVPFFWITRAPQHKFQGAFIHPEKGAVMFGEGTGTILRANTNPESIKSGTRFFYSSGEVAPNPIASGVIHHNEKTWGVVDRLMNPIAKANDRVRTWLREPVSKLYDSTFKKTKTFKEMDSKAVADMFINASIAYTPYFWAKSDWLAAKLDYGRMDAAVDRTLAGAATLNGGEFKEGLGEIWNAAWQKPLKDPVREKYAQCLEATDTSPADNNFDINPNAGGSCDFLLVPEKKSEEKTTKHEQQLSWRERLVQGEKPEIGANNPKGHAEREEMREALKHMQPPTNSIN
ncbi:MAG: hypothetical protein ACK502_08735 [Alphaproteobacteria bacterium]